MTRYKEIAQRKEITPADVTAFIMGLVLTTFVIGTLIGQVVCFATQAQAH